MPRIRLSNADPIDFCRDHFPTEEQSRRRGHANAGDGPDDRGDCYSYNDDHPPYQGNGYKCADCSKTLTARDDYINF